MAHWCESCGQNLPTGDDHGDAVWLGEPGAATKPSFTKPGKPESTGREKKLLLAVVAAAALWAAFVGVSSLTTPDDSIDQVAAAEIEEAERAREVAAAVEEAQAERDAEREAEEAAQALADAPNIAEVEGDYGAADAAPGFPDADGEPAFGAADGGRARTVSTVDVERLQRQLTRRASTPVVAYLSDEGVVLINLAEGVSWIADVSPDVTVAMPGDQILRTGVSSFAVNTHNLSVTRVGSESSLVVSDTADGNSYFVDAVTLAGNASIIEVIADGKYGFHRMPTGSFQLVAADGLGLLAVPKGRSGETLIAGPESFETISENRVITASGQGLLEQTCTAEGACSLVMVDLMSEERIVVPSSFVRFGDQYSLAPDGQSLLRYSPEGFAEVFVARDDSIAWVVGSGMHAPAWDPNSGFIAWIDRIGDPELKVMFTDDRDWLVIDVRDYGAPPPSGPDLIMLAPTEPINEAP